MHKLARLHFHECGYLDSYKESLGLDFRDPRNGTLHDAVLNIENGGGKTGLLALFFSCFDTRQDRYLRTLIKKHERFDQEFSDKPGVIVAEWALPNSVTALCRDDPRLLVTAQVVRRIRRAGGDELERHFLLFRANQAFHFEAFVQSLGEADVPAWLHELRAKIKPLQFWASTNQEQWQERLEENGIDVELLRMQVNFNREEGGVDHFLDVKNEQDFLLKFLRLTLNAETAESTRELLQQNIQQLGRRQQFKQQQEALRGLNQVFDVFKQAALAWQASRKKFDDCRAEAAGLAQALEAECEKSAAAVKAAGQALKGLNTQLESLELDIANVRSSQAALAHERLRRAWNAAQQSLATERKAQADAKRELQLCNGALAYREIDTLDAQIQALQDQIDGALKELALPRQNTRQLGTQLHDLLQSTIAVLEQQQQQLAEQAAARKQRHSELTEQQQQLQSEVQRQTARKAAAETGIRHHIEQRAKLEKATAGTEPGLLAGETSVDGLARWLRRQQSDEDTAAKLERENQTATNLKQESEQAAQTAREQKARLETEQTVEQKRLAQAEAEREQLAVHSALTRACAEHRIEPESSETSRLVGEKLIQLGQRLRTAEHKQEACESAGAAIRRAQLSGIDADCWKVCEALRETGLRDAQPYARWLAEQADEAALRAFAAADPARYTGVYVPRTQDLDKARSLDPSRLALSRPVQISVGALSAQTQAAAITLTVAESSAYSLQAARERLAGLEKELTQAQQAVQACASERSELEQAQQALQRYLKLWGSGQLTQLRQTLTQRQASIEQMTKQVGENQLAAKRLETEITQRRSRISQLKASAKDASHQHNLLIAFQKDWEAPLGGHQTNLKEADGALEKARAATASLNADMGALRAEEISAAETSTGLKAQRTHLIGEQAGIAERAEKAPGTKASLDALRAAYQTALDSLRAAEAGRLDGPKATVQSLKERAFQLGKKFDLDFAGLAAADLEQSARDPLLESRHITAKSTDEKRTLALGAAGQVELTAKQAFQRSSDSLSEAAQAGFKELAALSLDLLDARELQLNDHAVELQRQKQSAESAKLSFKEQESTHAGRQKYLKNPADEMTHLADGATPSQVTLAVELDGMLKQIRSCADKHKTAQTDKDRYARTARTQHSVINQTVNAPDFVGLEPALSAALAKNEMEAACDDAERLSKQLGERISSVEHDLQELDANHQLCLDKLAELTKQAQHQLHSAATLGVVPDSVPRFGGQPVLKANPIWDRVSSKLRRERLDSYVATLAAAQRLPEDAAHLAAECLIHVAQSIFTDRGQGVLGLQILKTNSEGELRHEPIHKLGSSGGERLTSALLLYLVMARLRAEVRVSGKSGGVLVLDNPFGKVNKPQFLAMQRAVARAMDVQLIYTTGIQDLNSLAEFPLMLRLRRSKKRGNRTLVEAVRLINGAPG